MSGESIAPSASVIVTVPATRGGAAACAEYSASDVTMICSMAVLSFTPRTSGASTSSVISSRMPESLATVSTSRAV